jgi:EAL and modified HD-GYP domain-containing signal transduction protein
MDTTRRDVAQSEPEDALRFMARQPILDSQCMVHGYELLFRAGPVPAYSGSSDFATRTMIDNTVMFGLEKLTAGLPAFVNCTSDSLTAGLVDVLPLGLTVLELLETVEPTPEVIAACRRLKDIGYRIALDDFVWRPELAPLVELADYIKVDFVHAEAAERQALLKRLKGSPARWVAEKVETQEKYKEACAEGFTLFQGYYFCRPLLFKYRKIPANQSSHIQILELLQHDPLDINLLSELVKRDASLTHRFLQLVNSPLYPIRERVRSLQAALLLVGDDTIRHVATLAITSEFNAKQPKEVLRMAFVRARFCELAAGLSALERPEQYLLGMFSLLPAMLQIPMADLVPALPLREKIREALQGGVGVESSLLRWVEAYERGDWVSCDTIAHAYSLNQQDTARCYAMALVWADEALQFSVLSSV